MTIEKDVLIAEIEKKINQERKNCYVFCELNPTNANERKRNAEIYIGAMLEVLNTIKGI